MGYGKEGLKQEGSEKSFAVEWIYKSKNASQPNGKSLGEKFVSWFNGSLFNRHGNNYNNGEPHKRQNYGEVYTSSHGGDNAINDKAKVTGNGESIDNIVGVAAPYIPSMPERLSNFGGSIDYMMNFFGSISGSSDKPVIKLDTFRDISGGSWELMDGNRNIIQPAPGKKTSDYEER